MRFERFMAYRYLLGAQGRSEGRRFLRFIMYAAVGGVAVGVAALLLSLSVVRGFSREIQEKIIGFGAHIQVESYQDAPLRNADGIRTQLARFEHVGVVSPVVQEFVLLRKATDQIEGVVLWGTEAMPPYLVGHLVAGTASFDPDERGRTGLVIGRTLSEVLGVSPGDVLTAFSLRKPPEDEGAAPVFGFSRPRVQQFYVSGIYETSLHNYDELYVFTEIEAARGLLQYAPDEVTRLDVSLTQVGHVERVRGAIEAEFGFPVMARTIYEVYRGLFAWVNLQENIIPLVISVIGALDATAVPLARPVHRGHRDVDRAGAGTRAGAHPAAVRRDPVARRGVLYDHGAGSAEPGGLPPGGRRRAPSVCAGRLRAGPGGVARRPDPRDSLQVAVIAW
jgi:lipoprotein-releasing system permease protein